MKTTRTPSFVNTSVFAKASPDKSAGRQNNLAAAIAALLLLAVPAFAQQSDEELAKGFRTRSPRPAQACCATNFDEVAPQVISMLRVIGLFSAALVARSGRI